VFIFCSLVSCYLRLETFLVIIAATFVGEYFPCVAMIGEEAQFAMGVASTRKVVRISRDHYKEQIIT